MGEIDEAITVLLRFGELTLRIVEHTIGLGEMIIRHLKTRGDGAQQPYSERNKSAPQGAFFLPRDKLSEFRQTAEKEGLTFSAKDAGDPDYVRIIVEDKDIPGFQKTCALIGAAVPEEAKVPPDAMPDAGLVDLEDAKESLYVTTVPEEAAEEFLYEAVKEDLAIETIDGITSPLQMLRACELPVQSFLAQTVNAARYPEGGELEMADWPHMEGSAIECISVPGYMYREMREMWPPDVLYAAAGNQKSVLLAYQTGDRQEIMDLVGADIPPMALIEKSRLEERFAEHLKGHDLTVLVSAKDKDRAGAILEELGVEAVFTEAARCEAYREPLDHRIDRVKNEHGAMQSRSIELPAMEADVFRAVARAEGLEVQEKRGAFSSTFTVREEDVKIARALLEKTKSSGKTDPDGPGIGW